AVTYAATYDVYLDGLLVSAAQAGTSYAAGILSAGSHNWQVIPSGSGGTATGCATWTFDVSLLGCYCASGASSTADEEIFGVTVNGNTNAPALGCTVAATGTGSLLNQYSNYFPLGPIFSIQQGVPATFSIQEDECDGATYYAFGAAIWVDYNKDGIFDDVTEKVFVEGATAQGPRNVVGSFTAPITAQLGTTAMRVTAAEGFSDVTLTSCLAYGFGETEDYLVTILPPPVPASGTAVAVDDCGNSEFSIDVNLTSFGDGGSANVIYSVNGGGSTTVAASLGSNLIGPFTVGDNVAVTADNGTISVLNLGSITDNCPVIIPCGTTCTVNNYCYGNNSTKTWTFSSDNVNETLTLTFVSGGLAPGDVIRAYCGTDNTGQSISSLTGTFANLAGVSGTSCGP
ncbi:MAG TPA: GEVED domain-containing protein, partial [Flavobacteriales bacterium]|nr:GEVED domain-containing protein [Flavobacteriales bacterium]